MNADGNCFSCGEHWTDGALGNPPGDDVGAWVSVHENDSPDPPRMRWICDLCVEDLYEKERAAEAARSERINR